MIPATTYPIAIQNPQRTSQMTFRTNLTPANLARVEPAGVLRGGPFARTSSTVSSPPGARRSSRPRAGRPVARTTRARPSASGRRRVDERVEHQPLRLAEPGHRRCGDVGPELVVLADRNAPRDLALEPVLRLLGDLHPLVAGLLAERRGAAGPGLGQRRLGGAPSSSRSAIVRKTVISSRSTVTTAGGLPLRREPAGEPARHALLDLVCNHVIILPRAAKAPGPKPSTGRVQPVGPVGQLRSRACPSAGISTPSSCCSTTIAARCRPRFHSSQSSSLPAPCPSERAVDHVVRERGEHGHGVVGQPLEVVPVDLAGLLVAVEVVLRDPGVGVDRGQQRAGPRRR